MPKSRSRSRKPCPGSRRRRLDGKCSRKPGPKRSRSVKRSRKGSRRSKGRLPEATFYCVSCRKRVKCNTNDIKGKKYGSRHALRCVCPCGTNTTKFVTEEVYNKYR
jgi:hypothetical protein